jgi:hypothetical protein
MASGRVKYSKTRCGSAATWTDAVWGSAGMVRLHRLLEALEPGRPQPGQERLERLEAFGTHEIEPPLPVLADPDQPGFLEHLEVLGDRLLGDVEVLGDLADRAGLVADQAKDRLPTGLCERTKGSVGAHEVRRVSDDTAVVKR